MEGPPTNDRTDVPYALFKATFDEFSYACKLRTGDIIEFTFAEIIGDFATLNPHPGGSSGQSDRPVVTPPQNGADGTPMTFDRGIEVRIADIVWVTDAPWGS